MNISRRELIGLAAGASLGAFFGAKTALGAISSVNTSFTCRNSSVRYRQAPYFMAKVLRADLGPDYGWGKTGIQKVHDLLAEQLTKGPVPVNRWYGSPFDIGYVHSVVCSDDFCELYVIVKVDTNQNPIIARWIAEKPKTLAVGLLTSHNDLGSNMDLDLGDSVYSVDSVFLTQNHRQNGCGIVATWGSEKRFQQWARTWDGSSRVLAKHVL